jgi:hypothetical protein
MMAGQDPENYAADLDPALHGAHRRIDDMDRRVLDERAPEILPWNLKLGENCFTWVAEKDNMALFVERVY